MKKVIYTLLKVLVSLGLFYYLINRIGIGNLLDIVKQVNPFFLSFGVLLFILCWVVNSMKWQQILRNIGVKVNLSNLIKLNFISIYYSFIFPGGQFSGEVMKCYRVAKKFINKNEIYHSILIDRLTGIVGIGLLGLVGLWGAAMEQATRGRLIFISLFIVICAMSLLYLFRPALFRKLGSLSNKNKWTRHLYFYLSKIITKDLSFGAYSVALLLSLLFQLATTFCVKILALSIGLDLNMVDLLWITALVTILVMVPISITGLGVREVGFIYLLGLIDVSAAKAMSLSMINFSVILFGALIGGVTDFIFSLQCQGPDEEKNNAIDLCQ